MVCFRYIIVNTPHKSDNKNNNNINNKLCAGSHYNVVICLLNIKFSAVQFLSFNPKFNIVNEIVT